MPQIDKAVDDDARVHQHGGKAVVGDLREFIKHGAQHGKPERKDPLYQQGGEKMGHDGIHYGICLDEPACGEQRLGAEPVGQIEYIKEKQLLIKRIAPSRRSGCGAQVHRPSKKSSQRS